MKPHDFTIILTVDPGDDATDRFYGMTGDGTLSTIAGVPQVHFHREATSLEEAIRSAITNLKSAGLDAARVEIAPESLARTA